MTRLRPFRILDISDLLRVLALDVFYECSNKFTMKNEFIGIDVSKQLQSSDFGGDLSDKQLKYCAQDVIYLHQIYNSLNNILLREKRIDIYNSTIKFINTRVELDLASFKEDIWSH